MSSFTLARVEPVTLGIHQANWDQAGSHGRHPGPRQARKSARARVLAVAAPDQDPADCEVFAELDESGGLRGIVVRQVNTDAVLGALTLDQLRKLSEDQDARGLFFERRG